FYQAIANQLKNQYLIRYSTRIPSGEHSLVIKVQYEESRGQDEKRFWTAPLPVFQPPTVSIVSPGPDDPIKGIVDVRASVKPDDTLERMRFYVDGVLKAENENAPFDRFKWDTADLPSGLHVIRVEAVDANGQTGYAEMTRKIISPVTAKKQALPPVEKEKEKGIPNAVMFGGILLLLILIAGGAVLLLKKKKTAPLPEPTDDIEDETIFIPEAGNGKPHPPTWLKVLESQTLETGKTFQITGSATVGRSSENDIHIPDKPVSRRHAEFYFKDDVCCVRDLGSKNGVRIDGQRIPPDGASLSQGQQIQLSPQTILEFHIIDIDVGSEPDEKTRKYGH
ncbi:FHA domain-containing protein, partial [Thermodesulfobacteriota bacterium]